MFYPQHWKWLYWDLFYNSIQNEIRSEAARMILDAKDLVSFDLIALPKTYLRSQEILFVFFFR